MTWDHPRGFDPLIAASAMFADRWRAEYPESEFTIHWEKRSLNEFELTPLPQLSERFDLIVIDHPHVGEASASGCLLPINEWADAAALASIAAGSVGGSYESYVLDGQIRALPIDAATQVSARREGVDPLPDVEAWFNEADPTRTVWPLQPVHALSSFFTFCANAGHPCSQHGARLIEADAGGHALEKMIALVGRVAPASFDMDPIDAAEALARGEADRCPMLYGYVNYARVGFRRHRLLYEDLPEWHGSVAGTTLGGTGLSVSAHSSHRDAAIRFSLAVASGDWQRGVYFDGGGQPAHDDAWRDPRINHATAGFFNNTRATLDSAWTRPRFAGFINFQRAAGDIVVDALRARIDIRSAVARLNDLFVQAQEGNIAS